MILHHDWMEDLCYGTEGLMSAAQLSIFRGDADGGDTAATADDPRNPTVDESLLERIAGDKRWSRRTMAEYRTTFNKLGEWWASCAHRSTGPMRFRDLDRQTIAEFVAWRHEHADGKNRGRTHNKAVEQLSCLLRWGLHPDRGYIDALPRLPDELEQRDDAGICFLTEDEINRLYWATYQLPNPRGWQSRLPVGAYVRCALVLFYNLGLDTQALFAYDAEARRRAIARADFFFTTLPPSRQMPIESQHGWVWWTRDKTQKEFERPLNREMHDHVRLLIDDDADRESMLMSSQGRLAGTHRPNRLFQQLCKLAKIQPKIDRVTRQEVEWNLKDLRKTCGAYQEAADYSPAADALGHSDSKVTYGHYTSGNIRASIALLSQRQPAAFRAIWDESIRAPGQLFAK